MCGGCSVPGVPYREQLERKRAHLATLLRRDVPPLLASPRESAYRQKAAFVFGMDRGRLVMGHYAAATKRIVAVEECPVHSARANRIAFDLRDRLVRAGIAAADSRGGVLRHLIVRTTEDQSAAVAMLVVSRNDKALRAPVRGLLESPERPDGFFVNINRKPGPYMVGDETIRIAGQTAIRERGIAGVAGIERVHFLLSPDAFFQTNVGAARELVTLVLEQVGSAQRVLDLYSGSGLFALPLALRGASVTAVEENRQAVADLQVNLRLNRIPGGRVRPVAARVEAALERLDRQQWDVVVLDPPRQGCASEVLTAVFGRIRPMRAVYVSCNPAALAPDLQKITDLGYVVGSVQGVDMFPHTEHIETVVKLERVRGG